MGIWGAACEAGTQTPPQWWSGGLLIRRLQENAKDRLVTHLPDQVHVLLQPLSLGSLRDPRPSVWDALPYPLSQASFHPLAFLSARYAGL